MWSQARQIVRPGAQGSCSVVTDERHDGPHELPIESLMLSDTPGRAVYVVTPGTAELSRRLDTNPNLSVIGRSTKRSTALHRLTRGRRNPTSGVELIGRAGTRRRATPGEVMRWHACPRVSRRGQRVSRCESVRTPTFASSASTPLSRSSRRPNMAQRQHLHPRRSCTSARWVNRRSRSSDQAPKPAAAAVASLA